MDRNRHILAASSNLLGISLLIIAGLDITRTAEKTFSDEIAWVAALCFSSGALLSYLSLRTRAGARLEAIADKTFLGGLLTLLVSVAVLGFSDFK